MIDRQTLTDQVEQFIDQNGLNDAMDILAYICNEKAEHIRSSYGYSDPIAKYWDIAADHLSEWSCDNAIDTVS